MRVFFVRHGETDYNKQKRSQGRIDIPLNEYGRELAECTKEGLKEIPFDLCFSSPLGRAKETADIILKDRNIPIYLEPDLIEISFGEIEGQTWGSEEASKENKDSFQKFFHQTEAYVPPAGGESIEELKKRTAVFLDRLFKNLEYQDKTILVATHGAALASILANIKGYDTANFWGKGCSRNCGVTELIVANEDVKIIAEDVIYY